MHPIIVDPDESLWFQRNPIEKGVFHFLGFEIQFQIYIKLFINRMFKEIFNSKNNRFQFF